MSSSPETAAWLDWDGPAYFQSQFEPRHAEVAHQLIERGAAYRCYLTPEELKARREKAQAERRPFRLESEWRDATDAGPEGVPSVIRLKAPREDETTDARALRGGFAHERRAGPRDRPRARCGRTRRDRWRPQPQRHPPRGGRSRHQGGRLRLPLLRGKRDVSVVLRPRRDRSGLHLDDVA